MHKFSLFILTILITGCTGLTGVLSGSWETKDSLLTARDEIDAAAVNGKIYVIGGFKTGLKPVSDVYEYDPESDKWTKKTNMNYPRGALTVAVFDEKIYAIGGEGEDVSNKLEVYHIETDT